MNIFTCSTVSGVCRESVESRDRMHRESPWSFLKPFAGRKEIYCFFFLLFDFI